MFRVLSVMVLSSVLATAQDAPRVDVPISPNATCPIMGKKVSLPLFVDTELGRIWVCCKPCFKKILANVPKAHQTAYPVVQELANKVCPVSGEPIGEHKVAITLQATRLQLCCAGCADAARANSQVVLAKVNDDQLVDVGNDTCPQSGEPVQKNAFVVIDGNLVHLSSPKLVDDVRKAPAAALAKARELAKAQPPKQKHVHAPAPADAKDAAKAGTPPAGGEPKK
jgi:uncharacterized protein (UPF0212 family)